MFAADAARTSSMRSRASRKTGTRHQEPRLRKLRRLLSRRESIRDLHRRHRRNLPLRPPRLPSRAPLLRARRSQRRLIPTHDRRRRPLRDNRLRHRRRGRRRQLHSPHHAHRRRRAFCRAGTWTTTRRFPKTRSNSIRLPPMSTRCSSSRRPIRSGRPPPARSRRSCSRRKSPREPTRSSWTRTSCPPPPRCASSSWACQKTTAARTRNSRTTRLRRRRVARPPSQHGSGPRRNRRRIEWLRRRGRATRRQLTRHPGI